MGELEKLLILKKVKKHQIFQDEIWALKTFFIALQTTTNELQTIDVYFSSKFQSGGVGKISNLEKSKKTSNFSR